MIINFIYFKQIYLVQNRVIKEVSLVFFVLVKWKVTKKRNYEMQHFFARRGNNNNCNNDYCCLFYFSNRNERRFGCLWFYDLLISNLCTKFQMQLPTTFIFLYCQLIWMGKRESFSLDLILIQNISYIKDVDSSSQSSSITTQDLKF